MNLSAADAVLLDASVLAELLTQGRHAEAADRMLDHLERNPHVEIVTAAHGLIEVLSAGCRLNLAGAAGLGLPLVSVDEPLITACTAAGIPAVHLDQLSW